LQYRHLLLILKTMVNIKSRFQTFVRHLSAGLAITSILLTGATAQIVTKNDVHEIVTKLATALTDRYPFPEISAQYRQTLLKNEHDGKYEQLTEQQLAGLITANLQQTHNDVHLHVTCDEAQYKGLVSPEGAIARNSSENELMQKQNFGFRNVDLDPMSSLAYVNIPGPFYATQESFDMAAAAMNLVAYSRYVIIDVRTNGGGSGQMGRFLASYFFTAGDEKYYLNGFYKDRSQDEQEWTYAYVPGKRNTSAKVFILISSNTGSAAEGFAYAMQQMHRATIVGEPSAGAGIAGSFLPLKSNLVVFLPFKMVTAPHSQTGWEGTGVLPDTVTKGKDALVETRRIIWRDILNNATDSTLKLSVQWQIDDSKAAEGMNAGWQKRYSKLIGKYNNNRSIVAGNNSLIWRISEPGKPVRDFPIREVKPDILTVLDLNRNYGQNSTRLYIQHSNDGKASWLNEKILLPNGTIYNVSEPFKRQ
jgi:hypothetical protein